MSRKPRHTISLAETFLTGMLRDQQTVLLSARKAIDMTETTKTLRRLGVRRRLADYRDFVLTARRITRRDVMRMGEVSIVQATKDLVMLREDYPELGLEYDKYAKAYVARGTDLP